MKKRIICLIMAMLLILACSCKKVPEEQTAELGNIETGNMGESASAGVADEAEKTPEQDVPVQQSPANQPAEKAEDAEQNKPEGVTPEVQSAKPESETKPEPEDGLYNYEVTEEPFEKMKVHYASADYMGYSSEQEMFDDSHLVIIGMPIETFTEGEEHYYTATGYRLEKGDSGIVSYCTVRNVKVLEVLKGENVPDTVKVANGAVLKDEADGSKSIIGLAGGDIITKKNVKYIYYLKKSDSGKYDHYYAAPYSGVVNVDGLDTRQSIGSEKYKATKARAAEFFKKYDRSAELAVK